MELTYSYWEKKHFFSYDVLVVGSGIVGLNAAIQLKVQKAKLKIAIVDRGFLPSGASTKNAGFACFGSISELIEQEHSCGSDGLYQLIKRRWSGLQKLRDIVGDKSLDFQCHGGYEIFKADEHTLANQCVGQLTHFNQLVEEIVGKKNTFIPAGNKIEAFGFENIEAMIENTLEAQIDSGKMMATLIKLASTLGISILNGCTVKQLVPEAQNIKLYTDKGTFNCKKVIVATNAFVKSLLPSLNVVPGRGQVIVTSPISNLNVKGTFHYQKGFYYFRNIDGRILLGGGRNLDFKAEETTAFGETDLVQAALKNLLRTVILPDQPFEIEYSWSGIMAFGSELHPIIEEPLPGVYCAVRCSGMGVAIGCETGQEVAEKVLQTL